MLPIDGYIVCKPTGRLVENGKEIFNFQAVYTGGHDKADSVDKFMHALRQAKRQHRSETKAKRLFIFENEHMGDISAPLLRPDSYYENEIREKLENRRNQDLILIIFRNFMQNPPLFSSSVFGPPSLNDQINLLRNFELEIIDREEIFNM